MKSTPYTWNLVGSSLRREVLMLFLSLVVVLLVGRVQATPPHEHRTGERGAFIENQGQWEAPFDYTTTLDGVQIFISASEITYQMVEPLPHGAGATSAAFTEPLKGHTYRTTFIGASSSTEVIGEDAHTHYHNYYLGADEGQWRTKVPLYKQVVHKGLYDGINMVMYYRAGDLKYDLEVAPGADVAQIQMEYAGQDGICLTPEGHLEINTSLATIQEMRPYAYQWDEGRKVEVSCDYILKKDRLSFDFPEGYDRELPLIIDPVLIFSTFTGSQGSNFGVTATFDEDGNGYAAGTEFGVGYPVTPGAFQVTFDINNDPAVPGVSLGETDIVITKFNPNGTAQIYSTYLGGRDTDLPSSIVVNENNELVVLGATASTDYPTTAGAYDRVHGGGSAAIINGLGQFSNQGSDICVTVFSADGSNLIGSTLIGGTMNDGLTLSGNLTPNYGDEVRGEVITDQSNIIYVTSTTSSTDFPTTAGAAQATYRGGQTDAVIFSFDRTLTNLRWSTYYGGTGDDAATSLELDAANDIYFTGGTTSNNLTIPANALLPNAPGGISDGYVARLSNNGGAVISATYLGTDLRDAAYFVDIDLDGFVYVLGNAYSGNYAVTPGTYSNPGGQQFIHKLDANLTTTEFSTVFGASASGSFLALNAFLVDECFRIYISGWGGRTNSLGQSQTFSIAGFPVTPDAEKSTTEGSDFYFMVLDPDARDIEYGSYFGGGSEDASTEHVDGGTSRFDDRGVIYQAVCAGCGGSQDFPSTPGAWSNTNNSASGCNLALVKLDFQLDEIVANAIIDPEPIGCAPFTVAFANLSRGPIDSFFWDFGDGTFSREPTPTKIYEDPGVFEVSLVAFSAIDCKPPDTARVQVVVNEVFFENQVDTTFCPDIIPSVEASVQNPNSLYRWNTGQQTPSIDVTQPGRYIVQVKDPDACFVDTFDIDFFPDLDTTIEARFCEIDERARLFAPLEDDIVSYLWDDGSMDRERPIPGPGTYTVIQTDINDCEHTATFTAIDLDTNLLNRLDITLCEARTVTIGASHQSSEFTYLWNDGSTDPTIDISGSGVYTVVTFPPLDSSCAFTDSFIVQTEPQPDPIDIELGICRLQQLEIAPPGPIFDNPTYQWSNGSMDPSITINRQGRYDLVVSYPFECTRTYRFDVDSLPSFELSPFYFPNAFSPNNDGINEQFRPFFIDEIPILEYHLQIFDRWGGLVFESFDPEVGWDGVVRDEDAGVFAFVWQCRIEIDACIEGETATREFKGELFLVR